MFAAIHFRLCLSLIPVMLSIPLAWKVHETKMLTTINDQDNNAKNCEYILLNTLQLRFDVVSPLRGKHILALLWGGAMGDLGLRHAQESQTFDLLSKPEIFSCLLGRLSIRGKG